VEWTAAPSGWDARNHAMQMDSRASSREMVAPPGREPLIATVLAQGAQSQSNVGVTPMVMAARVNDHEGSVAN
jgi:hypothetical protein